MFLVNNFTILFYRRFNMKKIFFYLLLLFLIGCSKDNGDKENSNLPDEKPVKEYPLVDIDWNKTSIVNQDDESGNIKLTFEGEIPSFKEGHSLIVLDNATSGYIRRVMQTEAKGNSITLKTIEADMSELFSDEELSFSLMPSSMATNVRTINRSRAVIDNNNVIYPTKIVLSGEEGNTLTIYDVNSDKNTTRNNDKLLIEFPAIDHSGQVIAGSDDGNLSLYWEKNRLQTSMKGDIKLKFGKAVKEKEITPNFKVKISELEEFSFTLDARAKWELILGALVHGEFEDQDKDVLDKSAFKKLDFLFTTPTGIPVYISLNIDFLYEYWVKGEAQLKATGGVTFDGDFQVGVKYTKNEGWAPIGSADFTNKPKPIEVSAFANLDFKASVYPRISIKLYNLAGPFLSVKPYFRDEVRAAFYNEIGSVSKDYYAMTEKAYAGIDLQAGILLGFVGLGTEMSLEPYTLCEGQVYNMPNKLTLQSPSKGTAIKVKEPIDVNFNLTRTILGQEVPSPMGIVVKFEAEDGKINHTYGLTDILGNVKVQWTPLKGGSMLKAKVFDEKMNVISEATYGPAKDIYGTWEVTYDSIYSRNLDGGEPWIHVEKYPREFITLNEDLSGVWMVPDSENDIFSYIYNEDYLTIRYINYAEEDRYSIEAFDGDSLVLVLKENNNDYFYQKLVLMRKKNEK